MVISTRLDTIESEMQLSGYDKSWARSQYAFYKEMRFLILIVNFLMTEISYDIETIPESKDASPPVVTSDVHQGK